MNERTRPEEPATTDIPAEMLSGTSSDEATGGMPPSGQASPAGRNSFMTTAEILWWERYELRQPRCATREEQLALSEEDYNATAQGERMTALCLSGGGIRSASFSLGVVQALAEKKLLTGFDYLSTVSGGGYLGSFLQRWMLGNSVDGRNEEQIETQLAASLNGKNLQVEQLREGANFITPKLGLMSSDTWTAIATSLRNISVNWTLFVPMILIVAAIPALFYWFLMSLGLGGAWGARAMLYLHWAAAIWAMTGVFLGLPSNRIEGYWTPKQIRRHILIPAAIAMVTMLAIVAGPSPEIWWRELWLSLVPWWQSDPNSHKSTILFASLGFVFVPAAAFVVAQIVVAVTAGGKDDSASVIWLRIFYDLLLWLFCGLAGGALLYFAAALAIDVGKIAWPETRSVPALNNISQIKSLKQLLIGMEGAERIVAFGPVIYVSCLLVVGWLFSVLRTAGRRDAERGKNAALRPDHDREWLVRISGDLIRPVLIWTVLAMICLFTYFEAARQMASYSGKVAEMVNGETQLRLLAGAIVSGATAAFAGKSSGTLPGGVTRWIPLSAIAMIATGLCAVISLFVAALAVEDLALLAYSYVDSGQQSQRIGWMFGLYAGLIVGLLVFLWFWGRFVDVNRFSLHGFYRYRLARAFLGAARGRPGKVTPGCAPDIRKPDPFTGIDPMDNVRLHSLWPRDNARRAACLFPVVNVALNAVATKKLSWQERKALPFVMTPLACGSCWLGSGDASEAEGAYIDSQNFGGKEQDEKLEGAGVTLAAAMAISGAAASPNMGYHSSPATAFLMALFNVRLGAWMPNPVLWKPKNPNNPAERRRNSVRLLLRELGGNTSEDSPDIYLSDGGHFENLGLYEMLRRRCASILAIDAGCDPDFTFEDLSNAARKAAIDMHIELKFGEIRLTSRKKPMAGSVAYAVADIVYPEGWKGKLIYLKPSLIDTLPIDVRAYASSSESFPHETTADQWYTESQFESYRNLGATLCRSLGAETYGANPTPRERVREFFEDVRGKDKKVPKPD